MLLPMVALAIGLVTGAACAFILLYQKFSAFKKDKERVESAERKLQEAQAKLAEDSRKLSEQLSEFQSQTISYKELKEESTILKRDLNNAAIHLNKLELDYELQQQGQESLDARCQELGSRYLKETIKWIGKSLTPNNYAACKKRIQGVIEQCRGVGMEISPAEESGYLDDLQEVYREIVRAAHEREEQARIKAQIREEQRLEREIERELQQVEREREAVRAALERALAEAHGEHTEQVKLLEERLAEAEARSQRAISRAQLTKSGHVYVISNMGSFGEKVFKIGMTRRLEPLDRIRELGDASVPFPFDVHMMIASDDAPKLENSLHRALHKTRLNKVNPRKEYFRSDLEAIRQIVIENHGEVEYQADPEALEYRQSIEMTEEDAEFIDEVFADVEDDSVDYLES